MSFLFSLAWFLTSQVGAPVGDPDLQWRTLETEHFYIHFPSELEKAGQRVAVRAEEVYAKRVKDFRWEPPSKVHVVLSDPADMPNGLSTPIPYNAIYLYGTPPLDDSALDDYDDWLHTLIAHEFTHTLHLDMAKGLNKVFRAIFGRFWLPNAPMQQWIHEGLAMFYETKDTTRGRGRSTFLQTYLRTVSLENKFFGIDRATYFNDIYPYGNSAYWYGIGFIQFLNEKFGEKKIVDFIHATATNPVIGFINFKSKDVFGKSLHRLWEEWRLEEKAKWTKYKNDHPSNFKSERVSKENDYDLLGIPVWDEKTKTLYAPVRKNRDAGITAFKKDKNGIWNDEKINYSASNRLSMAEGNLLYSKMNDLDAYKSVSDLYLYDFTKKKEEKLTHGLRLRDPILHRGFLIAVRTDNFKSSIVRIPWKKIKSVIEKNDVLTDQKDLETIYEGEGFASLSKPSGSPQRNEIVFSMKRENKNRDLFILNLETRGLTQLTDDPEQDQHPFFSADGEAIFYASETNIRKILRDGTNKEMITDSLTAVNFPCFASGDLFAGVFHAEGWNLEIIPASNLSSKSVEPWNQPRLSPKIFETKKFPTTSYRMHDSLLPRYMIPLFLYTETDSLLGLQTGSRDPLGFHSWSLFGFQLFGPNRPGGSLFYNYSGWRPADLFIGGYAGISNYGRIIVRRDSGNNLFVDPGDYYERSYGASAGLSHIFQTKEGPSNFSGSLAAFYENRNSLLGFPPNTLRGTDANGVRLSPEVGNSWGGRFSLRYANGLRSYPDGIGPIFGQILNASVDYTPNGLGSDFHTLTTVISGKAFFRLMGDHSLAFRGVAGMQWLDPTYQRPFLLGGSLGENPFSNVNRRSYPLRGLPTSDLRGEGLLLGSLEYRFPFVKHLPGFGTAPLWFKNLHGALFSDAGQTFQRQDTLMLVETVPGGEIEGLGWNRYSLTAGGEIRSDASIFYAPPLTYRLGYGYVLYRQGKWLGNTRQHEIYFQIGASF